MITILLDKGEFYSGQTIKGNVELVPDTEIYINDIELCFYYIEEWNYSKSDEKVDKRNYKQCISLFNLGVNRFLPEGDNNLIHLDPILHLFPFELKLPEFLYPSFEYPKHDYRAFLRYSLFAKLISPSIKLSTSNLIFILAISSKDNSSFTIDNTFNIKKWGMFGKGTTKINAVFPMKCYRFSDNIPIHINIDNTLGKMKVNLVKINLIRKMILKDNNDNYKEKYSCIDKVFKKVYKVEVRSGTKEIYDFKFPLNEMPHNEFSYFDNVNLYNWTKRNCEFIPSLESTILSCQYTIKITLYYDSFIKKSDRPRIKLPIYIVHKLNDNIIAPIQNNNNNITCKAEESNEEEIRKQKENDFVIINKKNNNGELYEKPLNSGNYNRAKTINSDNSYIENIAYNNKDIYNNDINIKNTTPLGLKENNLKNNNNLNLRTKTHIENNNINNLNKDAYNSINEQKSYNDNKNEIIENEDEGDAPPTFQLFNNQGSSINNNIQNLNLNKSEDLKSNNNYINDQKDINSDKKNLSENINNINDINN